MHGLAAGCATGPRCIQLVVRLRSLTQQCLIGRICTSSWHSLSPPFAAGAAQVGIDQTQSPAWQLTAGALQQLCNINRRAPGDGESDGEGEWFYLGLQAM